MSSPQGTIIRCTSGETSFVQDNVDGVTTEISEARDNELDFIKLIDMKGNSIWIDPEKVEAVFPYVDKRIGTK